MRWRFWRRRRNEPPGVWRGDPILYSRWRVNGIDYRLASMTRDVDFHQRQSRIVLEYVAGGVPDGANE